MDHQNNNDSLSPSNGSSSSVKRQTAVLIAVGMLVIGFISGTVFGVIKVSPLSEEKTGVSGKMPSQMFEALEAEANKNPQSSDAWTKLGNAYFDSDQYQKAISAYEKSLSIEPENPNVLTDLGIMYRLNKQPEKAVEMFNQAMSADPKHEMSRLNKGIVLLYDLKKEQEAVKAWEELLELNPLAVIGDGQSVDELVKHYKEGHDSDGGNTGNDSSK